MSLRFKPKYSNASTRASMTLSSRCCPIARKYALEQPSNHELKQQRMASMISADTHENQHGEHQAATIIALQAVQSMPANQRPIVLGEKEEAIKYTPVPGYSVTSAPSSYAFSFNRSAPIGYDNHRPLLDFIDGFAQS